MQPSSGEDNLELLYMVTESFVLSINPMQLNLINVSKHFVKDSDLSELDPSNDSIST